MFTRRLKTEPATSGRDLLDSISVSFLLCQRVLTRAGLAFYILICERATNKGVKKAEGMQFFNEEY